MQRKRWGAIFKERRSESFAAEETVFICHMTSEVAEASQREGNFEVHERGSINQIFHFTTQRFRKTDYDGCLCLADVILLLLVELYHAKRNTGCFAQLLLSKTTSLSDLEQFGFSAFSVPGNDLVCCFYKLAFIRFVEDIHREHGRQGKAILYDVLKAFSRLPLIVVIMSSLFCGEHH